MIARRGSRGSERHWCAIEIEAELATEWIPNVAERLVVAALGDSITEGSPEYGARRGGDETSQWEYWAARADPRLVFRNCGIYGQRTDEIAAPLDGCVSGAEILVVQGGINDIAQGPPLHPPPPDPPSLVPPPTHPPF